MNKIETKKTCGIVSIHPKNCFSLCSYILKEISFVHLNKSSFKLFQKNFDIFIENVFPSLQVACQ